MVLSGTGCFDCQSAGNSRLSRLHMWTTLLLLRHPLQSRMKRADLIWQKKVCPAASFPLSILCLQTQSTWAPSPWLQLHFAAQALTLIDKPLTFVAASSIFCATSVVPLCPPFSWKWILFNRAPVLPPHLHLLSIFSYVRTQRSSHKTEVLSSHRTLASFFYHHSLDSCCGNFLLPHEHGSL